MPPEPKDKAKTRRKPRQGELADQIVDEAIALAEETGWQDLRLRQVAERLGVPLSAVLAHYRDLDGVADAWFGRAWAAMLAAPPAGYYELPVKERLYLALLRWFDALAPHRAVSVAMIRTKIYPSHPHHWVPLVFNLSRSIQWLREVAALDAGGLRRQVEEVGLTALFLATLAVWAEDDSEGQERTRAYLRRRLGAADCAMARLCRARTSRQSTAGEGEVA